MSVRGCRFRCAPSPRVPASRVPGLGLRQMLPRAHYNVRAVSALNLDLEIFEPERASCARAARHSHPMQCINVRRCSRERRTTAQAPLPCASLRKVSFRAFTLTGKETAISLSVASAHRRTWHKPTYCDVRSNVGFRGLSGHSATRS